MIRFVPSQEEFGLRRGATIRSRGILALTLFFAACLLPSTSFAYYNLGAFWRQCSPFRLAQPVVASGEDFASNATLDITETAGHLLVVAVYYSNPNFPAYGPTVWYTLGNTWYAAPPQNNIPGGHQAVQIWYAPNILGGANSVGAALNAKDPYSNVGIYILEYAGIAASNPVDVTTGQIAPSSTATMATGGATATSNCSDLVVALFADIATSISAGETGWTTQGTDTYFSSLFEDNTHGPAAPASTAVNANATLTSSDNTWTASEILFRASGSTPPPQPTKIAFFAFTGVQSLNTWGCSGVVTVQSQNGASVPMNTPSGIDLSLSGGSAMFFFLDSACTIPITEAYIWAGTNSQNFYFTSGTTTSNVITVTPTGGLSAISQTQTITEDPYTWTGGAPCSPVKWATAACWKGTAVPGAGNIAHFDSNCTSNCSPSISAVMNVGGIGLHTGYAGTVTQGAFAVTVGGSGMTVSAGTFTGSATGLTINGPVTINGGTLKDNTGTITMNGNWNFSGGSYTCTTGTVNFTTSATILGDFAAFCTLGLNVVGGTLSLDTLSADVGTIAITNGTVSVAPTNSLYMTGNITSSATGTFNGSGGSVVFDNVVNYTISGSNTFGNLIAQNIALGATLTFQAGQTQTFAGSLLFQGFSAAKPLKLRSSTPGTPWKLSIAYSQTELGSLDVEDSDNTTAFTLHSGPNFINSGNNTGWAFP